MKKIIILMIIYAFMLGGCDNSSQPLTDKQFCLDTIVQISLYDSYSSDILNHCFDICNEFELIFSSTDENSELYKINHSQYKLESQSISDDLYQVISEGLYYSQLSNGQFDITIGAVSSLWDFQSDTPQLPDQQQLWEKLKTVSYKNIELEKNSIRYLNEETMIDLGGIAKGYIADKIKEYLLEQDVGSALINLGGNVLCVGDKNDEDFVIGLTDPTATSNSLLSLNIADLSVVTSGTYQRYFEIEGKRYHHILDPQTGYSYDNGLAAVTIVSSSSIQGDALSTICFALGKDEGIKLLDSLKGVYGCFVDNDNHISYSQGFKQFIK